LPISHDQCAPYLSTTLLRVKKDPALNISALREAIIAHLKKNSEAGKGAPVHRKIHKVEPSAFKHGTMDVAWIHYSEVRPPAWYLGSDLKEERHHVVFLAQKRGLAALTFSDASFRASIVAEIRRRVPPFDGVTALTMKQINDAFVGDRVRTLWLAGAHRRTATKADSKILTGIELEAALDPLEDQSYYFSSVRSTLDGAMFAAQAGSNVVIGANPRNARVWLGPSKDWSAFIGRVERLIDAAAQAIKNPSTNASPLPVLAVPIDGMAGANAPYDMAIIVPEAISAGVEDNEDDPWLHEFTDAARFAIKAEAGSPSFEAEVFWGRESYGRIKYEFSIGPDASPSVKTIPVDWKTDAEHQEAVRRICQSADLLTVYYDTGHTFSRGVFYATKFRDARFLDWRWARLHGFDVGAEKPLTGKKFMIKNIGDATDVSLFGFIAKHWPNYLKSGAAAGWLVCDDGSMESADFIHFDDVANPPRLTLIHVKGSGSSEVKRGLSVSDYEIVVGQAVKNLRYLDRSHIAEKLKSNKDKQIGSAVWHNGRRQKDREEILKILAKAGANMSKTVCVFQPSARRSEVEAIGKQIAKGNLTRPEVRRLQQLDALLLAARAECLGMGADFYVIGEDDSA
jgi:hypothetical protein